METIKACAHCGATPELLPVYADEDRPDDACSWTRPGQPRAVYHYPATDDCPVRGFVPLSVWNRRAPDPLVLRLAKTLYDLATSDPGFEDWADCNSLLWELDILRFEPDCDQYVDTTPPWDGETMPEVKR